MRFYLVGDHLILLIGPKGAYIGLNRYNLCNQMWYGLVPVSAGAISDINIQIEYCWIIIVSIQFKWAYSSISLANR